MTINHSMVQKKEHTNSAYKWIAFEVYPVLACVFLGFMLFRMRELAPMLIILFLLNVLLIGVGIGCIGMHLVKVGQLSRIEYTRVSVFLCKEKKYYTFLIERPVSESLVSEFRVFLDGLYEEYADLVFAHIDRWAAEKGVSISIEPSDYDALVVIPQSE